MSTDVKLFSHILISMGGLFGLKHDINKEMVERCNDFKSYLIPCGFER